MKKRPSPEGPVIFLILTFDIPSEQAELPSIHWKSLKVNLYYLQNAKKPSKWYNSNCITTLQEGLLFVKGVNLHQINSQNSIECFLKDVCVKCTKNNTPSIQNYKCLTADTVGSSSFRKKK